MRKIASIYSVLVVFLVLLVGCVTGRGGPVIAGKGSLSVIISAYFEPEKPVLTDTVYLVVNYEDPDGDVVNAYLHYAIAGSRVVYDGLLTKPEASGLIKGQKKGQLRLRLGSGWYGNPTLVVSLYLIDAEGNKSATIKREISVSPF